jgi:hypothetical protein
MLRCWFEWFPWIGQPNRSHPRGSNRGGNLRAERIPRPDDGVGPDENQSVSPFSKCSPTPVASPAARPREPGDLSGAAPVLSHIVTSQDRQQHGQECSNNRLHACDRCNRLMTENGRRRGDGRGILGSAHEMNRQQACCVLRAACCGNSL